MTVEHVRRLADDQLFLPRTQWHDLAVDHVPFDALEGKPRWERRATSAILRGDPVAVVAPVGAGKSSLLASVCTALPDTHVAFRMRVTGVEDPTSVSVMTAVALTAALDVIDLEQHQRAALEAARADQTTTELQRSRLPAGKLGGGPMPAEISFETGTLREEHVRGVLAGERLTGIDRLIGILQARGRNPVFVCDDLEAMVGGADEQAVVEGFFNGPVRAFLTDVDAPLVLGVQTPIAERSQTFLELGAGMTRIEIPAFGDAFAALRRIAAQRLSGDGLPFGVDDVVHADALHALVAFYDETGASLRFTLAALNTAAGHAADLGSEQIGAEHVRFATNEWRSARAG